MSPLAWLRLLHRNQSITLVNSNFRSWTGTNVSTLGWLDEGPGIVTQVCQMEHQLYDQFFPESDGDGTALAPLMDPLCTVLYDALRPVFIQLSSLESLCSLVDILQHEVRTKVVPTPLPSMTRKLLHRHAAHRHCMCHNSKTMYSLFSMLLVAVFPYIVMTHPRQRLSLHQVLEEQLGRRGDAVAPLRPVLRRILADIQERLTFRAQAFIKARFTLLCQSSMH